MKRGILSIAPTLIALLMLSVLAEADPANRRLLALEGKASKALSGDRLLLLGEDVRLFDLACPPPETTKGRRAKALLNTFLRRSGYLACTLSQTTPKTATCMLSKRKGLAGKDIAKAMVKSKLCYHPSSPLL